MIDIKALRNTLELRKKLKELDRAKSDLARLERVKEIIEKNIKFEDLSPEDIKAMRRAAEVCGIQDEPHEFPVFLLFLTIAIWLIILFR